MSPDETFWTKKKMAEWLGVKVSYIARKTRTRQWPCYRFSETVFSPEQRDEILAKHLREAEGEEAPAEKAERAPRVRPSRVSSPPPVAPNATPWLARTVERRGRRSA